SAAETPVTSTIGYEGQAPRHRFANTMRAGVPYRFDHAPALPARDARTAPQTLEFAARTAAGAVFTVRMPVPVWPGG
ncbi:MAG: hypothetical protein ACXVVU_24020, partial [Solirubrobacteraceae bacterium]